MDSIKKFTHAKSSTALSISLAILSTALLLYIQKRRKKTLHVSISAARLAANQRAYSQNSLYSDDTIKRVNSTTSDETMDETWAALGLDQPLVIAMVGLPARGKSYIVKMMIRYLMWTGFECQVFNVGSYRRKIGLQSADSKFFDPSNKEGQRVREQMATAVQEEMYAWLHESKALKKRVAIFDATNTTRKRRYAIAQRARKEDTFLLFVESICNDVEVLARNYSLKLQNEDYKNMDPEQAKKDFLSRVEQYEHAYETIEDDEDNSKISYIKLINVGEKVITRNCHGYLPSQVAFYLQNVHIKPRKILLSLCALNVEQERGTDRLAGAESGMLTEKGIQYTEDLVSFLAKEEREDEINVARDSEMLISEGDITPKALATGVESVSGQMRRSSVSCTGRGKKSAFIVLTGTSRIHYVSIACLKLTHSCYHTPLLNELRGGDFHGLSKAEIEELHPGEHEKRLADKLQYRYPGVGGESYLDVIERIRPVIVELERQDNNILVVCHLAVLRCIYAYFMGVPLPEIPMKEFQPHVVYELTPGPFGCVCTAKYPGKVDDR